MNEMTPSQFKKFLLSWTLKAWLTCGIQAAVVAYMAHQLRLSNGYLPSSPLVPVQDGAIYFVVFFTLKIAKLHVTLTQKINPVVFVWFVLYELPSRDRVRRLSKGRLRNGLMIVRTLLNAAFTLQILGGGLEWYLGLLAIVFITVLYYLLDISIAWKKKTSAEKLSVLMMISREQA